MLAALSFNIYPWKCPLKTCPQYKHLGNTFKKKKNKDVFDMSYLFSWPISKSCFLPGTYLKWKHIYIQIALKSVYERK